VERFEVIVVGAGPAGATAGYLLAKAGLHVLVIERGPSAGSKNVSGGLIYTRPVSELPRDFWVGAPFEREITSHRLALLSDRRSVALESRADPLRPERNAYSVLRARFDPWLAKRAEDAGAIVITGVTVEELLVERGRVIGVRAGPDELGADVVVIAEGTRSLLLKAAGLREDFRPREMSLGIKEIIALTAETINERFQCSSETGAAYTMIGHTAGIEGGGFLYTNRESLSVGVVVKLDSLYSSGLQPHLVLDEFKSHSLVERLIEGGTVTEFSAQTVHRGDFHLASRLYGPGYLVTGSAARLVVNNGMTLRGMDFAMVSGSAAARAIVTCRAKGTYDAASLAAYESILKSTAVYRDWATFREFHTVLDNPRLFNVYPEIAGTVLDRLFNPSEHPTRKAASLLRRRLRGRVRLTTVAKDLYQAVRGLVA